MNYQLIAIDLDHTLLNAERRISHHNQKTIVELSKHADIAFASGRPLSAMTRYAEEFPKGTIKYLLASNGAHCVDEEGHVFHEVHMEGKILLPVYREARRREVSFHLFLDGEVTSSEDNLTVQREAQYLEIPLRIVDDFDRLLQDVRIHKFHSIGEPEKLHGFLTWLKEQSLPIHPILSKPFILEVPPVGVDKGSSLEILARQRGFDRDRILSVGDSFNDLGMLRYAGMGLAMQHAPDGVRAAADRTLYINNEENLAEVLLRIVTAPEELEILSYKESPV